MESFREHIRNLEKTAIKLRLQILEMIYNAGIGDVGSSLSALDIIVALYHGKLHDRPIMYVDSEKLRLEEQDYFVLSKGQASPALYSCLASKNFFSAEELHYFAQVGSLLPFFPSKKTPGIFLNSGMSAAGFSSAIGLAMALKMDKQLNRVFCLAGEGELQTGQFFEAALAAAHYKLDNLILIIDNNGLQIDGATRSIMNIDPIADKFEAFGWKTIPVRNGHDFEELLFAFERAFDVQRKPIAIIAQTIKGKGVSFTENKYSYSSALSEQEMAEAIPKLHAELELLEKTT